MIFNFISKAHVWGVRIAKAHAWGVRQAEIHHVIADEKANQVLRSGWMLLLEDGKK